MAVSVQDLLDKIHFHVIYSTETALQKEITTSEIMRPGLEMAGYFDYFTPERIQLFGMKEWSYMMTVVGDNRYDLLKKVMAKETPVVIVARNLEILVKWWQQLKSLTLFYFNRVKQPAD